jgi:hypothetical protein
VTKTLVRRASSIRAIESACGDGRLVAHGTSPLMRLPGRGVKLGIPLWAA